MEFSEVYDTFHSAGHRRRGKTVVGGDENGKRRERRFIHRPAVSSCVRLHLEKSYYWEFPIRALLYRSTIRGFFQHAFLKLLSFFVFFELVLFWNFSFIDIFIFMKFHKSRLLIYVFRNEISHILSVANSPTSQPTSKLNF